MESLHNKIAEGFLSGHTDGIRGRTEELELLQGLNLGDYLLSDFAVTRNGPVILASYYVSVAETIEGQLLSSIPAPRLTAFLKTDDGWKWIAHSNFKVLKGNTAKDLKSFVESAADLIREQGEKVFPKFRKKGSVWFDGDRYVFVWGLDGRRWVYPPDPSGEGKNMLQLQDINDKPIGKMFVQAVTGPKKSGWVHYQWPKPGEILPRWKSTYLTQVQSPQGKNYLVGSGQYSMEMQTEFIVNLVNNAAELIEKQGKAAFDKLRHKKGPFVFRNTYVFVDTPDGTELVNPAFPNLEGRNIYDLTDASGKHLVKEYINLAQEKGSGWVTYKWPKPGENEPSIKATYVKLVKVNGSKYIVGSGMYSE
jgi:signal transduction histidine kinase